MTDLADRAIARLSEIDHAIIALEYERDEISTALRVLSSFLEPAAPATLPYSAGTEPAKHAVEEPSSYGSGEVQDRCESTSPTNSPETATDAGGFDSHSLTEIVVKPQVRVLPGVDDAKGGPTGMGRSDGGESPAAGEVAASPASIPPAPVDAGAADEAPADALSSEAATREAAASAAPETISADQVPPTLSKRQLVRITHEDHPDWSAAQIAEHLGLTKGSVSGHASSLGIKFAKATAAVPSTLMLTDRVRLMHEQHPTWTARMIALQLGEKESSVSSLLATVRKEAAAPAPQPEFGSEQEMRQHYGDVAARLGKHK